MGICPSCGSFVDEGEPYCPYCSYIPSSDDNDAIEIDVLEDVLNNHGYDLDDFESGIIDEDELEEILDEVGN